MFLVCNLGQLFGWFIIRRFVLYGCFKLVIEMGCLLQGVAVPNTWLRATSWLVDPFYFNDVHSSNYTPLPVAPNKNKTKVKLANRDIKKKIKKYFYSITIRVEEEGQTERGNL